MLFKQYAYLNVKIIGPSIGNSGKPIIDGDADGRCQEENGNWVPCPPGTGVVEALQQAASIKPWERPFEAGKWEKVDAREKAFADLMEILLNSFDENQGGKLDSEKIKELTKQAKQLTATVTSATLYINGPVIVDPTGVNLTNAKKLLKEVDYLYVLNPPKNKVNIFFDEKMPKDKYGQVEIPFNEGIPIRMHLNPKSYSKGERFNPRGLGGHIQNSVNIELGTWTVTHEWGHVLDTRSVDNDSTDVNFPFPDGLYLRFKNSPDAGNYAKQTALEMYAESFADWITSKGKSTNPVTLAYAKHFGWNAS